MTLTRTPEILIQVRFRGGATQTLTLPAPQKPWQAWKASPELVRLVDSLLNEHTDEQVAAILDERGLKTGKLEGMHNQTHRVINGD